MKELEGQPLIVEESASSARMRQYSGRTGGSNNIVVDNVSHSTGSGRAASHGRSIESEDDNDHENVSARKDVPTEEDRWPDSQQ